MIYPVVVEETDEGFSVSCPGLPGCWSQGETEAEALENVKDAIREYMAARADFFKDGKIYEVEVTP
jgi:predicted RNase H-like HicB family nuclease